MSLADKLEEEKNVGRLKIKDIYDVLLGSTEVFIKPSGRRVYFVGTVDEIPEELLKAIITEVNPNCRYEDDETSVKRWKAFIGIWVEPITSWDIIADKDSSNI